MVGLPGSGKTTWAKNWINENPKSRLRVSRDDIRKMLGPSTLITTQREALISIIESTAIRNALKRGYDVVVDSHHLNPKVIQKWKSYVDEINKKPDIKLDLEFIHLNTPLEVCILRDANRSGDESVGKHVILNLYKKYIETKPGINAQSFKITLDKDWWLDSEEISKEINDLLK